MKTFARIAFAVWLVGVSGCTTLNNAQTSSADAILVPEDAEGNAETAYSQKLRIALQQKYGSLPVLPVQTSLHDVSFATIDLTDTMTVVEGQPCYAFCFKTPQSPGTLVWSFRADANLDSWYVIPTEGRMHGFTHFTSTNLARAVPGLGQNGDRFILQMLPAENLKQDTNYVMWFGFKENANVQVTLSLNVLKDPPTYVDTTTPPPWIKSIAYDAVFPMLFE